VIIITSLNLHVVVVVVLFCCRKWWWNWICTM